MNGTASDRQRLLAFGIDYLLIAVYLALLAAASFAARWVLQREIRLPATRRERTRGHVVSFLSVTLPITLYFARAESLPRGATFGKRALGLRVITMEGDRVPFRRALLRAAAKFMPWEIAHTTLWGTPGWPVEPQLTAYHWLGYVLSLLLSGWYVVALFAGRHRTPYDRIARTRVVVVG
jgi:uncharacterized RDD family membrane protein YckC